MANEGIVYNGSTCGPSNGVWSVEDGGSVHIYRVGDLSDRNMCVMFDLDYTLIVPKSGYKYPVNAKDWRFTSPTIVARLRQISETHGIVIISNLCSYNEDFRSKIQDIVSNLGACPIVVILSTRRDHNCKPNTGMLRFVPWVTVGFIGDCAGREGDFATSDVVFARRANIPFYTPEHFFGPIDYPVLKPPHPYNDVSGSGCCWH